MDQLFSSSFPYRIEQKLGEGGMGIVYLAFDPELHRKIAIKVLRAEALQGETPAIREHARLRFLQEARAAATLTHPGVTTIFRIGEESGSPYIAMEYLDGQSLEAILSERAPLPVEQAAQIGVDLAEALAAAHRAGVVHRDIKPANLMILNDGRLKVTDFGIARIEQGSLVKTQAGVVMATPLFASPEQIRGLEADARSDIYSAGVVLYLCLTGRRPFDGRNFQELLAAVLGSEPAPIRQFNNAVPEGLESAVLKALSKDPEDRFPNASIFADALRPYWVAVTPIRTLTGVPLPGMEEFGHLPSKEAVTQPTAPILTGLSADPRRMIADIVSRWPARPIGLKPVEPLLARLLETPVHAEPFSGGVLIGKSRLLLLHDGWISAAIDLTTNRSQDEIAETLPVEEEITLHALPPGTPSRLVPLLSCLLAPRKARHGDLDSSFINLPAMARKMEAESFSGVLSFRRGTDVGYVLLSQGQTLATLLGGAWSEVPIGAPWESWISDLEVKASIEELVLHPVSMSYRHVLRDLQLDLQAGEEKTIRAGLLRISTQSRPLNSIARAITISASPRAAAGQEVDEIVQRDSVYQLLGWAVNELPAILQAAKKLEKWKYLEGWLHLIRKATLHHQLPRPGSGEKDFFDLVTADGEGKVLHVGKRVAVLTTLGVDVFIEEVKSAKTARDKRGDIGGAFLLSPSIDDGALAAYRSATKSDDAAGKFSAESMTGYEGFVRMAARRGFHLMLVREVGDRFEPVF